MQTSQYLNQLHTADKLSEEPWPEDATLYQVKEVQQNNMKYLYDFLFPPALRGGTDFITRER